MGFQDLSVPRAGINLFRTGQNNLSFRISMKSWLHKVKTSHVLIECTAVCSLLRKHVNFELQNLGCEPWQIIGHGTLKSRTTQTCLQMSEIQWYNGILRICIHCCFCMQKNFAHYLKVWFIVENFAFTSTKLPWAVVRHRRTTKTTTPHRSPRMSVRSTPHQNGICPSPRRHQTFSVSVHHSSPALPPPERRVPPHQPGNVSWFLKGRVEGTVRTCNQISACEPR